MKKIEALLFDLGGVLVRNKAFDRLQRLSTERLSQEKVRKKWQNSEAVQLFEQGLTTPGDFGSAFILEWDLSVDVSEFLDDFASWPEGFYPGGSNLLAGASENYTVACLTNSNEIHWARLETFSPYFDRMFSSHLFHIMKPDPEIFYKVFSELDVNPSSVAFFDDTMVNVEAARDAGMFAECVRGIEELKLVIAKQGFWPQSDI